MTGNGRQVAFLYHRSGSPEGYLVMLPVVNGRFQEPTVGLLGFWGDTYGTSLALSPDGRLVAAKMAMAWGSRLAIVDRLSGGVTVRAACEADDGDHFTFDDNIYLSGKEAVWGCNRSDTDAQIFWSRILEQAG